MVYLLHQKQKNFYSQSNRLNLLLPGLLTDVFDVMETTINKLSIIGKKKMKDKLVTPPHLRMSEKITLRWMGYVLTLL